MAAIINIGNDAVHLTETIADLLFIGVFNALEGSHTKGINFRPIDVTPIGISAILGEPSKEDGSTLAPFVINIIATEVMAQPALQIVVPQQVPNSWLAQRESHCLLLTRLLYPQRSTVALKWAVLSYNNVCGADKSFKEVAKETTAMTATSNQRKNCIFYVS